MECPLSIRWGVWCDEPRAGAWLRELADARPGTSFVAVRVTPADDVVWQDVPNVTFVADWQSLLTDRSLQAVMIAGVSDERLAALRQLAEQERPLWIWPDARHGLPFAYELALIEDEQTATLMGVWPHRRDPVVCRLAALREADESVAIEHFEFSRMIGGDQLGDTETAGALEEWLLPDLDLLRWLGAAASRVTSLQTLSGAGPRPWKQSVLLAADTGPGAHWAGEIVSGSETSARLQVRLRDGPLVVTQQGTGPWRVEADPQGLLAGPGATGPDPQAGVPWSEVVRVFEWFDACDHSLARRRTIELHSEPVSERTVFKTQMTALGCAVLLGTLLLMLVYLAIGATVPLPGWALLLLRAVVFAPLVIFLLAQLLLPLSRSPRSVPPRS
jgi:hypothetical protein